MFLLSSMGTCQVVVVPEGLNLASVFDGIIRNILMAFSKNIFQAYTGMFVFQKIMFSHFDKPRKSQNALAAAAPKLQGQENSFNALGVSIVDQKQEM